MGKRQMIAISLLEFNATSVRAEYDQAVIDQYAERMNACDEFPPIIVYFDGDKHYCSDGSYRCRAAQKIGRHEILAELRQGSLKDAIEHAASANATHGSQRKWGDVEKTILLVLSQPEWQKRSDNWIAKVCKTTTTSVWKVRAKHPHLDPDSGFVECIDGRTRSLTPQRTARAKVAKEIQKRAAENRDKAYARQGDPIGQSVADFKAHVGRASLVAQRVASKDGKSDFFLSAVALLKELAELSEEWEEASRAIQRKRGHVKMA